MTAKHLERLCKTWQKRLRLQDWQITIRLIPEGELPPNTWAHNEWEDEEVWSKIRIQEGLTDEDTERHLVHELLHLRLDEWEVPYGDPRQERVVNLLTDCFLQAYPHRRKPPIVQSVPILPAEPVLQP